MRRLPLSAGPRTFAILINAVVVAAVEHKSLACLTVSESCAQAGANSGGDAFQYDYDVGDVDDVFGLLQVRDSVVKLGGSSEASSALSEKGGLSPDSAAATLLGREEVLHSTSAVESQEGSSGIAVSAKVHNADNLTLTAESAQKPEQTVTPTDRQPLQAASASMLSALQTGAEASPAQQVADSPSLGYYSPLAMSIQIGAFGAIFVVLALFLAILKFCQVWQELRSLKASKAKQNPATLPVAALAATEQQSQDSAGSCPTAVAMDWEAIELWAARLAISGIGKMPLPLLAEVADFERGGDTTSGEVLFVLREERPWAGLQQERVHIERADGSPLFFLTFEDSLPRGIGHRKVHIFRGKASPESGEADAVQSPLLTLCRREPPGHYLPTEPRLQDAHNVTSTPKGADSGGNDVKDPSSQPLPSPASSPAVAALTAAELSLQEAVDALVHEENDDEAAAAPGDGGAARLGAGSSASEQHVVVMAYAGLEAPPNAVAAEAEEAHVAAPTERADPQSPWLFQVVFDDRGQPVSIVKGSDRMVIAEFGTAGAPWPSGWRALRLATSGEDLCLAIASIVAARKLLG